LKDISQYDSKRTSGYITSSVLLNRGVNLVLSVIFMILLIPVIVVIIPAVTFVNGWPFVYAGVRLGKNKKKFFMYKFRTLPTDFEQQYDGQLVSYQHGYRLPWFCRFMRDTRLDEIPQLVNIFKGDMDFVGPRPVRPSVYKAVCQSINGYDKRFSVNPGLIGYSQLFTPHSTPKRIRSFIDNRATRYNKIILCDILIIFLAGFGVIFKTSQLLYRVFSIIVQGKILHRFTNKRTLDRVQLKQGKIHFCTQTGWVNYFCDDFESNAAILKDINEEFIRVDTQSPIKSGKLIFKAVALANTKLGQIHSKSFYSYGMVFRKYENSISEYKYTYIILKVG
jgi:lipopolysaccharide/colanic/teichoic acid biosynthesis glycosyltransferase